MLASIADLDLASNHLYHATSPYKPFTPQPTEAHTNYSMYGQSFTMAADNHTAHGSAHVHGAAHRSYPAAHPPLHPYQLASSAAPTTAEQASRQRLSSAAQQFYAEATGNGHFVSMHTQQLQPFSSHMLSLNHSLLLASRTFDDLGLHNLLSGNFMDELPCSRPGSLSPQMQHQHMQAMATAVAGLAAPTQPFAAAATAAAGIVHPAHSSAAAAGETPNLDRLTSAGCASSNTTQSCMASGHHAAASKTATNATSAGTSASALQCSSSWPIMTTAVAAGSPHSENRMSPPQALPRFALLPNTITTSAPTAQADIFASSRSTVPTPSAQHVAGGGAPLTPDAEATTNTRMDWSMEGPQQPEVLDGTEKEEELEEEQQQGAQGMPFGGINKVQLQVLVLTHPLLPRLIDAFVACRKAGCLDKADTHALNVLRTDTVLEVQAACVDSLNHPGAPPPDPDLDTFMEQYVFLMEAYRFDLSAMFSEADEACAAFGTRITKMLQGAVKGHNTAPASSDASAGARSCAGEGNADNVGSHFKSALKRRYGDAICALQEEFSKKKRIDKLPNEALRILQAWWAAHTVWPYPTDDEKRMLTARTGLTSTQINNYFINQRKRHWHKLFPDGKPATENEARSALEARGLIPAGAGVAADKKSKGQSLAKSAARRSRNELGKAAAASDEDMASGEDTAPSAEED